MPYIFLFVLLFNFTVLADGSGNSTLIPARRTPRRRSIVSLIFSNATATKPAPVSQAATCRWFRGYKHQNTLCRKRKGFPETLLKARNLAVAHCEEQFKFDRWNCSYKKSIFRKVFRETAFLHAITSSAIMYSVAKACADGELQRCRCAEQENSANPTHDWKWGGCGDNTKQAKKITKKFLQLKQKGDGPQNILVYNSLVGMQIVAESEMKVCKCHGVSASCIMKTCWKSLHPFGKISEKLKHSYHSAVQHLPKNTIGQTIKAINKNPGKLLYLASSPNFCSTTAGRRCMDANNCATLCCGRGFTATEVVVHNRCRCRWQRCCFDILCDTCPDLEDVFTCK